MPTPAQARNCSILQVSQDRSAAPLLHPPTPPGIRSPRELGEWGAGKGKAAWAKGRGVGIEDRSAGSGDAGLRAEIPASTKQGCC